MDGGKPGLGPGPESERGRRKEESKLEGVRSRRTSVVQGRRRFGLCYRGVRWYGGL